jgi:arginase
LRDARSQVAAIFGAGQIPLVVGGECTLTIAVVSAAVEADYEVGLVYFDGGPDLRTPVDNPVGYCPWAWRTCWTCPVGSQNSLA